MGMAKKLMMEEDDRSHFANAIKHNYDDICETNRFIGEQTRTLRNKYGQFERVYGELWAYSEDKDMFVPNHGYMVVDYIIESTNVHVVPKVKRPAPAAAEPLGYHNLTTDDL